MEDVKSADVIEELRLEIQDVMRQNEAKENELETTDESGFTQIQGRRAWLIEEMKKVDRLEIPSQSLRGNSVAVTDTHVP